MARRLEFLTSAAFLVLCLVGIALGAKQLFWPPPAPPAQAMMRRSPAEPPPMYVAGERLDIRGVDFRKANQTLLLVVRQGCRFCDESMPFYRSLGADDTLKGIIRIIVLAPDSKSVSEQELQKGQVRVDDIVQMSLGALKVRGTPTAIVVGRDGVIRRVMSGRLDEAEQASLIETLKSGSE